MPTRLDQRQLEEMRPHGYVLDFAPAAEGSLLIHTGKTRIICTASVEDRCPNWVPSDQGWVTAEYSMLPRATVVRNKRDQVRQGGRTHEIQRLIGRSLRAVTDLKALAPYSVTLDCDVIEADAGTRTAAITGAWVALALACERLRRNGKLRRFPLIDQVAGVSVGVIGSQILLDMTFEEDKRAGVDLNLVMTGSGKIVEVQGTAEGQTFDQEELSAMIALGRGGLEQLFEMQRRALAEKEIQPPKSCSPAGRSA